MCANCGCGYATYDDIETGSPAATIGEGFGESE